MVGMDRCWVVVFLWEVLIGLSLFGSDVPRLLMVAKGWVKKDVYNAFEIMMENVGNNHKEQWHRAILLYVLMFW